MLRLHPLSVADLGMTRTAQLLDLLRLGGFPELFFGVKDYQTPEGVRVAPAVRLLATLA